MRIQRSKPFMSDYLPEQEEPTDAELAVVNGDESAVDLHHDYRDEVEIMEENDGQPSEYDEWQDYMGGDDWDQGQYDHDYYDGGVDF